MTTKLKFKQIPMCELTHDRPAEFFVYRGDYTCVKKDVPAPHPPREPIIEFLAPSQIKEYIPVPIGNWVFACMEEAEKTGYYFAIPDFFKSPAAIVDWLAHLSEKSWFDADDFMTMMHRFRKATDSYGVL